MRHEDETQNFLRSTRPFLRRCADWLRLCPVLGGGVQMNIDWSIAPEGATHCALANGCAWHHVWYKIEEDRFFFVYSDDLARGDTWEIGTGSPAHRPLIARPVAWSGEGLPPVGAVCFAFHEDIRKGKPLHAQILKHHENGKAAAFHWLDAPEGKRNLYWAGRFELLRTPEQIAAEERERAIDQMVQRIAESSTGIGLSAAMIGAKILYDAGYRKPEGGAQ